MLQKHTFSIEGGVTYLLYSRWAQDIIVEFTKSTDWGETWTDPIEVFRTQETGLFDMVARGDSIHVVWPGRFDDDHMWETYYLKSENSGDDWTDNLLLTTLDDRGSMWPSISINERGKIIVCWVDFKYSPYWWTGDLFVKYSHDAGQSWTEEEQITFTHLAIAPRVIWQGDSIHVAWEDHRHDQADIFYMISTDSGESWEAEQRIEDELASLHPDVAVVDENIHVVWRQDSGLDGRGIYYSRWEQEVNIVDDSPEPFPDEFNLVAYPNPFNSSTIITYNHLEGGAIEIYNIGGKKIITLNIPTEEGKIIWDARDALGNKVSSGIYFARATGAINYSTMKLTYLK